VISIDIIDGHYCCRDHEQHNVYVREMSTRSDDRLEADAALDPPVTERKTILSNARFGRKNRKITHLFVHRLTSQLRLTVIFLLSRDFRHIV